MKARELTACRTFAVAFEHGDDEGLQQVPELSVALDRLTDEVVEPACTGCLRSAHGEWKPAGAVAGSES